MTQPVCLIIDTTIQGVAMAFIALPAAGKPVRFLWQGQHAANAGSLEAIARLLREGLDSVDDLRSLNQLAGMCMAVGPGSFTGIKVGLAFAYGLHSSLSLSSTIPSTSTVPASIPQILGTSGLGSAAEYVLKQAQASGGKTKQVALLLPATRTHGFLAVVESGGGSESLHLIHTDLGSPEAGNALELISNLASDAQLLLCGESWPAMEAVVAQDARQLTMLSPSQVSQAAIYGMAERCASLWPHGFSTQLPSPLYLRLSTAEESLMAQKKAVQKHQ